MQQTLIDVPYNKHDFIVPQQVTACQNAWLDRFNAYLFEFLADHCYTLSRLFTILPQNDVLRSKILLNCKLSAYYVKFSPNVYYHLIRKCYVFILILVYICVCVCVCVCVRQREGERERQRDFVSVNACCH